jgi:hypothetical protein
MYQEYPKWVVDKDGVSVIAHSAEEEAKMTGKSESALEKDAEKKEKAGEAAQAKTDALELAKLEDQGQAVSEADVAKLTDAIIKRGPGRPPKAS